MEPVKPEVVSTNVPLTTKTTTTTTTTTLDKPDRLDRAEPADDDIEVSSEPRLLPPQDKWVMVDYVQINNEAVDGVTADLTVFELDGRQLVLTSSPHLGTPTDDQPLSQARPLQRTDRVTLRWSEGGRDNGLTGFGFDVAEFRQVADSLILRNDRWLLPTAREILFEPGSPGGGGFSTQIEFAPVSDDGTVDRSRAIGQLISTGSEGDPYRQIGEASGFGIVRAIDIGGANGFVLGGSSPDYALSYQDGQVTSWDLRDSTVDLEAFLSSLAPVDESTWLEAIPAGAEDRRQTLEAPVADVEPIPAGTAPRFVLPKPWTLEAMYDESQGTDEQRDQARALEEATDTTPDYEVTWHQTFRTADNVDAVVPDVLIEIQQAIRPRPAPASTVPAHRMMSPTALPAG